MMDLSNSGPRQEMTKTNIGTDWPKRPNVFPDLMTPAEAAVFLRLASISTVAILGFDPLCPWLRASQKQAFPS